MVANTSAPTAAAGTLVAGSTSNHNLSTTPRRMAVVKVWDATLRGARKRCEQESFMTVHNMPLHRGRERAILD